MSDIQRARSHYNNGDWGAARVEYETLISDLETKLEAEQFAAATIKAHLDAADEREKALTSRLHQLSEDHSHCEDLLHELGARASSAENRLAEHEERFQSARDAFDAQNIDKLLEAISGVRFEKPDAATMEWARREVERLTK
jgi:chromosome segregation ATPase